MSLAAGEMIVRTHFANYGIFKVEATMLCCELQLPTVGG